MHRRSRRASLTWKLLGSPLRRKGKALWSSGHEDHRMLSDIPKMGLLEGSSAITDDIKQRSDGYIQTAIERVHLQLHKPSLNLQRPTLHRSIMRCLTWPFSLWFPTPLNLDRQSLNAQKKQARRGANLRHLLHPAGPLRLLLRFLSPPPCPPPDHVPPPRSHLPLAPARA